MKPLAVYRHPHNLPPGCVIGLPPKDTLNAYATADVRARQDGPVHAFVARRCACAQSTTLSEYFPISGAHVENRGSKLTIVESEFQRDGIAR